jgi:hypothetical protein
MTLHKIDIIQIIQILANIGVVAGIIFLGYELRQNTVATQLSAASDYEDSLSEVELLIASNPEFANLLQKGIDGDDLTDTELLRLTTFYRRVLRGWQVSYYQNVRGALDDELWHGQVDSYSRTLRKDAGLRSYWEQNKFTFSEGFNDLMSSMLVKSDQ